MKIFFSQTKKVIKYTKRIDTMLTTRFNNFFYMQTDESGGINTLDK